MTVKETHLYILIQKHVLQISESNRSVFWNVICAFPLFERFSS